MLEVSACTILRQLPFHHPMMQSTAKERTSIHQACNKQTLKRHLAMTQPIVPPMERSSGTPGNPFATLPPGWTTEADPKDGRLFYWHAASGASSWTHPNASVPSQAANNHNNKNNNSRGNLIMGMPRSPDDASFHYMPAPAWTNAATTAPNKAVTAATTAVPIPPPGENPYMASRRPDNHQCGAIAALVLCPPLGIFALYHSIRVDQCWKAQQYSGAYIHSRQSPQFSSWGMMIGIIFWICWFFFRRGRGEWEWPDWKFGD